MAEDFESEVKGQRPWAGRFSRAPHGRRFAIGDVHGCVRTLRRLLEEQIRPEVDDRIVLLGDYIDRGPDGKGDAPQHRRTDSSLRPYGNAPV